MSHDDHCDCGDDLERVKALWQDLASDYKKQGALARHDASPQADRPRFVDPGRGPRQAVVASPAQRTPHACRLSCVEPGHDEWIAAVQGAPPATIPAINGPWIPGAAPAVQGAPRPTGTEAECEMCAADDKWGYPMAPQAAPPATAADKYRREHPARDLDAAPADGPDLDPTRAG